MKTHTLKFKGNHGRPKKIVEIRDLNEAGQPKSDQDILDEALFFHLTPAVSLYADTTSSERSEQNG